MAATTAVAAGGGDMSAYDVRCRLEAGQLTTRTKSGCPAWQRFVEVVDRAGKPQGFVMCTAGCAALLRYSGRRTGTSHLNRHRCTTSPAAQTQVVTTRSQLQEDRFARLTARWLTKELLPTRVLDAPEFRDLTRALADVTLSSTTVAALMREVTVEEKGKFAGDLGTAMQRSGVGLVASTWQQDDTRHAALLMSFVDRNWSLRRGMITYQLDELDGPSELVPACFAELSLEMTSAESSVMVAVGESPVEGVQHNIRCSAAMLHAAVRQALIKHPAEICRSVLDYIADVGLEEYASEPLPGPDASHLEAIFYVYRNYTALAPVVPQLSSLGENTIRGIAAILEPFTTALADWNSESHPTLNLVVLWYYKLIKHCRNKLPDDSRMEAEFRAALGTHLEMMFEIHDLHKVATFLWPQFRTMRMLPEVEQETVCDLVYGLIQRGPESTKPPRPASKRRESTFSEWEECGEEAQNDEVERYLDLKSAAVEKGGLLAWWREHKSQFPKLARLARAVLAVPATASGCLPLWQRQHLALLRPHELEPYLFLHHYLRTAPDFVPSLPTPRPKRKNDSEASNKHKSQKAAAAATKVKEEPKNEPEGDEEVDHIW